MQLLVFLIKYFTMKWMYLKLMTRLSIDLIQRKYEEQAEEIQEVIAMMVVRPASVARKWSLKVCAARSAALYQ